MTARITCALAILCAALVCVIIMSGPAHANAPTPPAGTTVAPATVTPSASASLAASAAPSTPPAGPSESPTGGELVAACVALLAGAVLGGLVIALVRRVHEAQEALARRVIANNGTVTTSIGTAAGGGPERAAVPSEPGGVPQAGDRGAQTSPAPVALTGPSRLTVGTPADYVVADGDETKLVWSVSGLSAYERTQSEPRKLTITPHRASGKASISVTDGVSSVQHDITVSDPPPSGSSLQIQLVIRNWGLVVVAIAVVFGAIALGLAGALDGSQFVALVAPLAALLGVTAAAGRGSSGSGGAT